MSLQCCYDNAKNPQEPEKPFKPENNAGCCGQCFLTNCKCLRTTLQDPMPPVVVIQNLTRFDFLRQ